MNLRVESLQHISVDSVRAYLDSHGWITPSDAPLRDGYALYVAPIRDDRGADIRVAVPTQDLNALREVAARIVGLAAAIERRSPSIVAAEMSIAAVDVMDVRVLPADGGHRLRLDDCPGVYEAIHKLFACGAEAEIADGPKVDRRPGAAEKVTRSIWVCPAEPRSFSFRVETVAPVTRDLFEGVDGDPTVGPPIQRRTFDRVVRGLQQCHAAAEMGAASPATKSNGLTAKMCDALVLLHSAVDGACVEFGAEWSPVYPAPPDVADVGPILYTPRMAQVARNLAAKLRGPRTSRECTVIGTIFELKNKSGVRGRDQMSLSVLGASFDADNYIGIKTSAGGLPKHVYCSPRDNGYADACDAHKVSRVVVATGVLEYRQNRWVLDPMKSFEPRQRNKSATPRTSRTAGTSSARTKRP